MNFYPLISISGFGGETEICSIPPEQDSKFEKETNPFVYATYYEKAQWHYIQLNPLWELGFATITQNQIPHFKPTRSYFIFMSKKRLQMVSSNELPTDPNFQSSQPEWRANLRILSKSSATSYMGDYPGNMTIKNKGSFVSISPMIQKGDSVQTDLIFVNITSKPERPRATLKIATIKGRRVIGTIEVNTNAVSRACLNDYSTSEPYYIYSDEIFGIPIYFSYNSGKNLLSMEHTHPPVEYLFSKNRYNFIREMKQYWLRKTLL